MLVFFLKPRRYLVEFAELINERMKFFFFWVKFYKRKKPLCSKLYDLALPSAWSCCLRIVKRWKEGEKY
jgi:hypothetical protein